MTARQWKDLLPLAAVLAVQLASYLPALTAEHRFNQFNPHDSVYYETLARALAGGVGYTRSLDPQHYIPHGTWPPGYPLMLAPCFLLEETSYLAAVLTAAIALGNTVLFWLLARRYLSVALTTAAALCLVCSPVYDQLATVLMADQATTFFLLLSLLCLDAWRRSYRLDGWAVGAVAAIGYGLLVKPLWVLLLPALLLWAILDPLSARPRRSRVLRAAALSAAAMLPWAVWLVRCALLRAPGYDGIGQIGALLRGNQAQGAVLTAGQFARTAWENLTWYLPGRVADSLFGLGSFLRDYWGEIPGTGVSLAILLVFAVCWVAALRRFRQIGLIALAAVFVPLPLLLKGNGGCPRYWLPCMPMFILVLAFAAQQAHAHWLSRTRALRVTGGVILAACCAAALLVLAVDHRWRRPNGLPIWDAFHDACRIVRRESPPDSVVWSPFPDGARLISRRFAFTRDVDFSALRGQTPTRRDVFVIVPRFSPEPFFGPHLQLDQLPGRPVRLAGNAYFGVYRLRPSATHAGADPSALYDWTR